MLKKIYTSIYRMYVLKASREKRAKYLRSLGVKIGRNCNIHTLHFSTEPYLITLGDDVTVAPDTKFVTHDGSITKFKPEISGGIFGKITVGNNVFIGNNCVFLPNTVIGDNCIVGAGSIVRGRFPENSVIFGNPAKIVLKKDVLKTLFKKSSGLLPTDGLSTAEKDKLVKKAFKIED